MKTFKCKNALKKLIVILLISVIVLSFVPSQVHADTDTAEGGETFAPFSKFVTFLCDSIMQFLQSTLTSNQSIEVGDGTYNFQYSPAIIFSGTVPALDINFIKPNEDTRNTNNYGEFVLKLVADYLEEEGELDETVSFDSVINEAKNHDYKIEKYQDGPGIYFGSVIKYDVYYWEENNTLYVNALVQEAVEYMGWRPMGVYSEEFKIDEDFLNKTNSMVTYSSIADELQPMIATWYRALRRIVLVGLLSVLLYIGIRIVLASVSAKDNSKYKKMLTDWIVALCLLFTIHYIMSFTLTITKELSSIFQTGETDELLNTLRAEIFQGNSWAEVTASTVMYVALTIFTVIFTYKYMKRVLYMAFFTLIAPLVTFTYPLDKIKDGQAQAFSMWIKEYVYNALIQVIHLIIYYVLVGSAIELVKLYPLYALVVIGFMTQSEQIIRKMFGFQNATTLGNVGAAATGGLVANAMNKLQRMPIPKGGKAGGSDGGTAKGVRTASNNNPLASLQGNGGAPSPNAPSPNTPSPNTPAPNTPAPNTPSPNTPSPNTPSPNTPSPNTPAPNTPSTNKQSPERKTLRGFGKIAGKYTRPILSKGAGLLVGGAGAMVGFAAGVAQGDFSAAATGLLAGGKAGYYTGQKGVNAVANLKNIPEKAHNVADVFREGAYGEEYAQNVKFDREFRRSSAYKELKSQWKDDKNFDTNIQTMLDAGITDKNTMEKILKSGGNIEDEIGYYTLAKQCTESVYYDDNKLQQYLQDLGLSQTNATIMRNKMKKYK